MKTHFIFFFLFFSLFFCLFSSRAHAAKLLLNPETKTVSSGEQFTVSLILDTEGKAINGADVTLTYPQNILWVDKVEVSQIFNLSLQKILKNEGKLILNFSGRQFSGQSWLANLTLSTHTTGDGWLNFICDDINIWEAGTSTDLMSCNNLKKGVYVVEAKTTASATPTPSSSTADCMPLNPPGNLQVETGPKVGQVTLKWDTVKNADYYTVTYGLVSRGYIYGVPNIGRGNQYTVSGLSSGRKYYFVLTSVNRCGSSGYSSEVSARAGGSLPAPAPADEKGGWPGTGGGTGVPVVQISPWPSVAVSPLPSATSSAQPSLTPEPSPAQTEPTGFIPPKLEPFWRGLEFWKKVGIVAVALFILMLIISFLRGKSSSDGEEGNPYEVMTPVSPSNRPEASETWPPQETPPL